MTFEVSADAYARFMGRFSEPLGQQFAELADVRPGDRALDVRSGVAENLPFADDTSDVAMAQLVVHFMSDPIAGLREMARVTRPGGWSLHACGTTPEAAGPSRRSGVVPHDIDPGARDESGLAGTREGHLAELCGSAGLQDVESTSLTVDIPFASFSDWWAPSP